VTTVFRADAHAYRYSGGTILQLRDSQYRVKNWAAYDIALRERGDITVWFDEESIFAWNASPSGRPGGQRRYSDLAIVTALTLRTVFHLPLRQTEGFVSSLIGLMGLALKTPDHTTLSRRSRDIKPRALLGAQARSISSSTQPV
jgi:hypothetical protein